MKMVVVTDSKGALVAAQQGTADRRNKEAGLIAGPDQKLHEINVPEELMNIRDAHEFSRKIKEHLPRR